MTRSDQTAPTALAIFHEAVRTSPRSVRLTVLLGVGTVLWTLTIAIVDLRDGADILKLSRIAGIVLASIGYGLLVTTHVLHSVSQQPGDARCSGSRMPFAALRTDTFHTILLLLPVLAIAAAVLFAIALGLTLPSVPSRPLTLVIVALLFWCLAVAVRTAAHTSRFLYGYAERQQAAAAAARAEASEARLAALQAQLHPHFLFNALNTVAALVRSNPRTAETTVEHLADVLRRTLSRTATPLGTLAEEVEYLRAYLAVEQARWGDRLRVEWEVAPEALSCALPPMTLQPLVENALKHGLGNRLEGGRLRISASRENGALRLTVEDDGAGFQPRWKEGTGLGNLRRRLATLYGDAAALEADSHPPGTTVRVRVPVEER